ncbi:MAG: hypothetical protein C0519_15705 [Hyphomicrobium sp.]|jgi:hypothetical protein|nr:hypothetical protein [Hyphomicrobium sp.]
MKSIIKAALVAVTLAASGAAAHAHTVWRFPFKSAPYAVPHEHHKPAVRSNTVRKHMHRHGAIAEASAIVIAHHKPPYHDGLPRTSPPTVPQPKKGGNSAANFGTTDVAALA